MKMKISKLWIVTIFSCLSWIHEVTSSMFGEKLRIVDDCFESTLSYPFATHSHMLFLCNDVDYILTFFQSFVSTFVNPVFNQNIDCFSAMVIKQYIHICKVKLFNLSLGSQNQLEFFNKNMTGYDEILILEIEYNIHNFIILRVLRRHNFIHPKNILKSFLASQDKSVFTIQIGQTQKSLLSQVLECARIIPTAFFECIHVAYIYFWKMSDFLNCLRHSYKQQIFGIFGTFGQQSRQNNTVGLVLAIVQGQFKLNVTLFGLF